MGIKAGASVSVDSIGVDTRGRHLSSPKATQAIGRTTKEHQMGSFPPTPAGRGRGGGQTLTGRCAFLQSLPADVFL